jgi:hypothetical protein
VNYREEAFKAKFRDAATNLGARPDRVVSLKLRDQVGSYGEYQDLLHSLEHEAGLPLREVQGEFQGRAFLLGDDHAKVILVEHETGLEILYISASIASLIGVVPVVLQGWRSIRGHLGRRHAPGHDGIELRYLDRNGLLREEHCEESVVSPHISAYPLPAVLAAAASLMERQMSDLAESVRALSARIEALEGQLSPVEEHSKPRLPAPSKPTKSRRGKGERT